MACTLPVVISTTKVCVPMSKRYEQVKLLAVRLDFGILIRGLLERIGPLLGSLVMVAVVFSFVGNCRIISGTGMIEG